MAHQVRSNCPVDVEGTSINVGDEVAYILDNCLARGRVIEIVRKPATYVNREDLDWNIRIRESSLKRMNDGSMVWVRDTLQILVLRKAHNI